MSDHPILPLELMTTSLWDIERFVEKNLPARAALEEEIRQRANAHDIDPKVYAKRFRRRFVAIEFHEITSSLIFECALIYQVARIASEKIRDLRDRAERGQTNLAVEAKPDFWKSLLTKGDIISQRIIIRLLTNRLFPDDVYVAEEGDTDIGDPSKTPIYTHSLLSNSPF